ncbi:MAG: metal-dependent hydrolase [Anaerolineales bacterium]|nr:MAG: metal-dependent hydrolase [Anaerolineales bacterium]
MAQAGMHALVGTLARKVAPKREWLILGIILGSLFPDLDNYAVAVATLAKLDTHGLHRTFTHSLFTILAALAVFFIIGQVRKEARWTSLGAGFGIGIGLHIALDLLIWFNGVETLWPLGGWINLWEGVQPPAWFAKLLDPAELLFIALFFAWLARTAREQRTNADFLGKLRLWTIAMVVLFLIFTPLAYLMSKGFLTVFGVAYLVALTAAFWISIRMRQTIEA